MSFLCNVLNRRELILYLWINEQTRRTAWQNEFGTPSSHTKLQSKLILGLPPSIAKWNKKNHSVYTVACWS